MVQWQPGPGRPAREWAASVWYERREPKDVRFRSYFPGQEVGGGRGGGDF